MTLLESEQRILFFNKTTQKPQPILFRAIDSVHFLMNPNLVKLNPLEGLFERLSVKEHRTPEGKNSPL